MHWFHKHIFFCAIFGFLCSAESRAGEGACNPQEVIKTILGSEKIDDGLYAEESISYLSKPMDSASDWDAYNSKDPNYHGFTKKCMVQKPSNALIW